MNVYQLKPKAKYGCGGGMALVAAPNYEAAVNLYKEDGAYRLEYEYGDFTFKPSCDIPIYGLTWEGDAGLICDQLYFE